MEPFALIDGMYKRPVAMECARQLIQGDTIPDAIFVGNDHMAFAVMDALREAGITVGQDISIVGYDDVPLAGWASYDLTTVRQPVNRMVDSTVELLMSQMANDASEPGWIEIDGELILRSSARIPKGWSS